MKTFMFLYIDIPPSPFCFAQSCITGFSIQALQLEISCSVKPIEVEIVPLPCARNLELSI
jgi:hypothetical protein